MICQNQLGEWLDAINLKEYAEILVDNGFDDLDVMKQLMRTDMPLTHESLKSSGIIKCGHRARILVRLEFESGLFFENP